MSKNIHIVPDNGQLVNKRSRCKNSLEDFQNKEAICRISPWPRKSQKDLACELIIHRRNGHD